jgi:RND family efflux transporter MFP subunit
MTTKRGDVALKLRDAIFLLSLISTGLSLFGCSRESGGSQENEADKLISAVEAVQARHGTLPLTERLSGVVKAKNQIEIYPEINAAIVEVYVENGEVVKRGQPLVRLRDNEFRERLKQARAGYQIAVAQAKQAEAQLQEIQAELKRTEALAEKELVSATELETARTRAISAAADLELAEARVEQAQATVDERAATLSQTVIRAPITGTVGNRNAEVGTLVNNSTHLFTLGQLDSVRVQVVLTDRMLNYIETGQRTEIYAENTASGSTIAALSRISPFLHPVTHSTDAEIDLANPDGRLKSGMFVTVDVFYGESEQATLIPLSALYENPSTGGTGVYVCQDSLRGESVSVMSDGQTASLTNPVSFKFVPVEVIAQGRMSAGVTGVAPGSWVVTIGHSLLDTESATARVRPVHWEWVEQLQNLQREDLLQEVLKRQSAAGDSTLQREAE